MSDLIEALADEVDVSVAEYIRMVMQHHIEQATRGNP